eukprot:gene21531-28521_t
MGGLFAKPRSQPAGGDAPKILEQRKIFHSGSLHTDKKSQIAPDSNSGDADAPEINHTESACAQGQRKRPTSATAPSTKTDLVAKPPSAVPPPVPRDHIKKEAQTSKDPFIKALTEACAISPSGKGGLAKLSSAMEGLQKSTPNFFKQAGSGKSPLGESLLRRCTSSVTKCLDAILQPIHQGSERILAGSGASASDHANWDSVRFDQFLEALEGACRAEYGGGLAATVSKPVAVLTQVMMNFRDLTDRTHMGCDFSLFQVPSLCSIVSALAVIFYRKVVLESGANLQQKLGQVRQLTSALAGKDPQAPRQLASCLDPPACAMLMSIEQGASSGGELKFPVTVSRGSAFWDSLDTACKLGLPPASPKWGQSPTCYKAFPSFVDEMVGRNGKGKKAVEAGEGHGPRKEYFLLVGQCLSGQQTQQHTHQAQQTQHQTQGHDSHPTLFTYNRSAGTYWYSASLSKSPQLEAAYRLAGWLTGQGIVNRAPLGLSLPSVLFQAMLEGDAFSPTLDLLKEFDPDAAASITQVISLPKDQLQSMMEMEDLPISTTAAQYMVHATKQILVEAVDWQSSAFRSGFLSALDRKLLSDNCLGPQELSAVVAGGAALSAAGDLPDFQKLFRVVLDKELRVGILVQGYPNSCSARGAALSAAGDLPDFQKLFQVVLDEELSVGILGDLLWEVLAGWEAERRKAFLHFVTGSPRPPVPGTELLKVEAPFVAFGLAEYKAQLGMLPQAHTCDNLLELPDYWRLSAVFADWTKGYKKSSDVPSGEKPQLVSQCKSILDDRLTIAVTTGIQGYGLDERDGSADGGEDDDEDDYNAVLGVTNLHSDVMKSSTSVARNSNLLLAGGGGPPAPRG